MCGEKKIIVRVLGFLGIDFVRGILGFLKIIRTI